MILLRPQANSSFFILRSSFTKAKISAFPRTAKNRVSVLCKNLLIKSEDCVNKTNVLIYKNENGIFARGKHCFVCRCASDAFREVFFACLAKWIKSKTVICHLSRNTDRPIFMTDDR